MHPPVWDLVWEAGFCFETAELKSVSQRTACVHRCAIGRYVYLIHGQQYLLRLLRARRGGADGWVYYHIYR